MSREIECMECGGAVIQPAYIKGWIQIHETHEDGTATESVWQVEDEWDVDDYKPARCADCGTEVELWR